MLGSVQTALQRAQQALKSAETQLGQLNELPDGQDTDSGSSYSPLDRLQPLLRAARGVGLVAVTVILLVASHAFGLVWQWVAAVIGAAAMAGWGIRRGALSTSGALAALFVGAGTLGCSLRFGATLIAFFLSSSKLTQLQEEVKAVEEDAKQGGQRDWKQVFCNGFVPTLLSIAYGILSGFVDVPLGSMPNVEPWRAEAVTLLLGGFLGYYACCCGDTWASELGMLSKDTPRLITTLRPVRRGTNGGVTLLGLTASLAGGLFVGAVFYAAACISPTLWVFDAQHKLAVAQWRLVPLGLMAGLFGSIVDSVLGATVQFTGYNRTTQQIAKRPGPDVVRISGAPLLTNNTVNLVSASVTAVATALLALRMYG